MRSKQLLIESSIWVMYSVTPREGKYLNARPPRQVIQWSGKIVVELNRRLKKYGIISLLFDIGVKEIEGWTARLLPSRQEIKQFDMVLERERRQTVACSFGEGLATPILVTTWG